MHIKKQRLLTAGPTPLLPQALRAMMGSDIYHRTEDFRALYREVLNGLREVFGTRNEVLCLAASGTGGLEAAVSNFFRAGDKVIVCSAGKFGERWVELARAFGLSPIVLEAPYGEVVVPERVSDALKQHPDARGVLLQASETSTGAEFDVRAIAGLVRAMPAILVVDAITGLGTMPLDIDGWGLDVVVGGSQKAFMIPPGLAFVSVSEKAWQHAASANLPRLYFDLSRERKSAAAGESTWTASTSLILALAEALRYIRAMGMEKLIANAQSLAAATRSAAKALDLELFAPACPASAVTAIRAPKGIDSSAIVGDFRDQFGSIIANGQGAMKGKIFRIAHLGYFDFPDLFAVVAQLEVILASRGVSIELGAGVAAIERAVLHARAAAATR
jgi:aspartate aminotransferase-like enzyme